MSKPVYSSENMRQWDAFTIVNEPISSVDLMERAASKACSEILKNHLFHSVSIFCGPGNNGGDGLVIARILAEQGKIVNVYHLDFAIPTEDFKINFERLPETVNVITLNKLSFEIEVKDDLIIDAIFGSGLNRPISGWIGDVTKQVNNTAIPTVAIDIPSGLFATDNQSNDGIENCIRAIETLTFMVPKMAFFYKFYDSFVGNFKTIDIGLHPDFHASPVANFVEKKDIVLRKRAKHAFKGTNGFLTIIGGLGNMTGAALIASRAAMKSGAGYVHVISTHDAKLVLNEQFPEAMWSDIIEQQIPEKTNVIAIGPGLGISDQALQILKDSMALNIPMVLDADAINLLAQHREMELNLPTNSVLTPHFGELKRLVGDIDSEEKLLEAQLNYSIKHQVYIIQKGPFSKLTTPSGEIWVNSSGNPGMASAGMGDALTGIIGSLMAQGYTAMESAMYGMFLHGYAADVVASVEGEIGLLATDVINKLPRVINDFTL